MRPTRLWRSSRASSRSPKRSPPRSKRPRGAEAMEHILHLPKGYDDPTTWVLLALFLFLGLIAYLKLPAKLGSALDARADRIRKELDEAKRLRDEAQELLASFQRRQR